MKIKYHRPIRMVAVKPTMVRPVGGASVADVCDGLSDREVAELLGIGVKRPLLGLTPKSRGLVPTDQVRAAHAMIRVWRVEMEEPSLC